MNKININECWKPVVGFEGIYEVSDLGNVRSLNYNHTGKVKLLSPSINKGYYQVGLYKNGKQKHFSVHTLVITAFRGPIPAGMQVNHLNENKLDNRLSNLEVVTAKQNLNWGTRNERAGKAISKALKGNTNGNKELKLTHAKSCAKYTFSNSYGASEFFGYKNKTRIGSFISLARKQGENFINIRGEKHYFSQEA